uniref:Uncharacterized protein n=1 Tax=Panagrolaimus sp. PS1159 TaxID=55785 RepID=A0AC35GED5_9BILA
MSFKSQVLKDISNRIGLFKSIRDPEWLTSRCGEKCAVFINQGLTCTDVILYYMEDNQLQISQKQYAAAAWEAALVIGEGINAYTEKNANEKNVLYN